MPVFAVHYNYLHDSVAGRNDHRAAHRAFLDTLTGPVKVLWPAAPTSTSPLARC